LMPSSPFRIGLTNSHPMYPGGAEIDESFFATQPCGRNGTCIPLE